MANDIERPESAAPVTSTQTDQTLATQQ